MIGEEVRRRREDLGLTGAQLAARAGMAPSAVSQIETGKRMPNFTSVIKLAEALGLSVGDLFPKGQVALPLDYFVADAPLGEEVLFHEEYTTNDVEAVMARAQDVMRKARSQYVHGEVSLVLEIDDDSIEVRAEAPSQTTTRTTRRMGRRKAEERT
jgi:transcriptional regulator with XRE-family HTH domain